MEANIITKTEENLNKIKIVSKSYYWLIIALKIVFIIGIKNLFLQDILTTQHANTTVTKSSYSSS